MPYGIWAADALKEECYDYKLAPICTTVEWSEIDGKYIEGL